MRETSSARRNVIVLVIGVFLLSASIALLRSSPSFLNVPPAPSLTAASTSVSVASTGAHFDNVVIIVMENHGICDILTSCGGSATYLTSLANSYGLATHYTALTHPSMANYITQTSGDLYGTTNGQSPGSVNQLNIVDRVETGGLSWKAYMESYNGGCSASGGTHYTNNHNPFIMYTDIYNSPSRCAKIVNAGDDASLSSAVLLLDLNGNSPANYTWLSPNKCNDMHDDCGGGAVTYGDNYMSRLVPQILSSNLFQKKRAALFITFDEGSSNYPTDYVYTVWAGPVAKTGFTSSASYSHYSHLVTIESNWNLPTLTSNDAGAAAMNEFFGAQGTPDFSLSASPTSVSFAAGQSGSSTVTLHPTNGFSGTVSLLGSSSPAGVPTGFSPSSITGTGSSTCTLSSSTVGSYTVTITGTSGSLSRTTSVSVTVAATLVPPSVTSLPASSVGQTTSTINGNLTGLGTASSVTVGFQYGTSSSLSGATNVTVGPRTSTGIFLRSLTGLVSSTRYFFRAWAVGNGFSTGSILSFVTAPPTPPPSGNLSAQFAHTPTWPNVNQTITFDATASTGNGTLQARWDWTDDGTWDTPWSTTLISTHAYVAAGAFSAHLQVKDATGAVANTTQSILADSEPPVTTLSVGGTMGRGGWFISSVTATLSATDDLSGVSQTMGRRDGASWQPYAGAETFSGDGTHTFDYDSTDRAGNAEAMHTVAFRIDTVAPITSYVVQGTLSADGTYYVTAVTVSLSATDATSGVGAIHFSVDGGAWQTYGSTVTVSGSGTHNFAYYATDNAGLNEATRTLLIPIGAPASGPISTLSLSGTLGSNGWYMTPVTISLTVASASGAATAWYSLDGGIWTRYTAPFSPPDGNHSLAYNATDSFGVKEATRTAPVRVDTTPPVSTVQLTGKQGRGVWYISNVTVKLSASDATSGVASIAYQLDGGSWQTYSNPFLLTDGRHTLALFSTDVAGLVEAKQTTSIKIDTTPPHFGKGSPKGIVTTAEVAVAWSATDDEGFLTYDASVNGGAFQALGNSTSLILTLPDGPHYVTVRATDEAGNEAIDVIDFRVDTSFFSPTGPYGVIFTYVVLEFALVLIVAAAVHRRRKRRLRSIAPDLVRHRRMH